MQSLPQKLEAAAAAIVQALGVSVDVRTTDETTSTPLNIQTGLSDEDKATPSITFSAMNGQEFPQGSGNFTLTLTVDIKTSADATTLEAHRVLCEEALEPLMSDDTEAQLTAAEPDFGCMGISNRQCNERIEDRSWITTLQFDAYCMGTALT
jgi:hypothetical protein